MRGPDPADIDEQAFSLMKELVAITGERWVPPSRFSELAKRFGHDDVKARIVFLTGVRTLMREMPVKVFPDLDVRHAILKSAQDALDHAVEAEEEGEEAGP